MQDSWGHAPQEGRLTAVAYENATTARGTQRQTGQGHMRGTRGKVFTVKDHV